MADRAACDAGAGLAADPRQSDPAADPGDRYSAHGTARGGSVGSGDPRAQPDLHLQLADAGAGHRVVANDGDGARAAVQCGTRCAADLSGWPVADRGDAASLLA